MFKWIVRIWVTLITAPISIFIVGTKTGQEILTDASDEVEAGLRSSFAPSKEQLKYEQEHCVDFRTGKPQC